MKLLLSIVLSILVLSPIGLRLMVFNWWNVNQKAIATELCENRFDPTVMCSGKCVLLKELKKVDASDQQSKNNDLTNIMKLGIDVYDLNQQLSTITITSFLSEKSDLPALINKYFDSQVYSSLFKPPVA